jgi:hypothetical protein
MVFEDKPVAADGIHSTSGREVKQRPGMES